jgi:antitoxin MazE
MAISTDVSKWGNSLGIRIPQAYAKQLGITADSKVNISVEDGKIVISRGVSFDDMMASLSAVNLPVAEDLGSPVGREELI